MRDKAVYVLGIIAAALLVNDMLHIIGLPDEKMQGAVFKIIFFHVPVAFTALTACGVSMIASALFLITRNFLFDALAVAVTEVGLAFLAANLVTGSIWGRETWGIWWTWDARLTSALICWVLYASYLMLRKSIEEPTQRAIFAAVFSIFCFIDVPIVIFSIKWWRTQHPQPVFWAGGSFPADWAPYFWFNVLAMMLLGAAMTLVRLRDEESQRELESLRRMANAY
ncbi:MAG TPA: cytochrome c biogenesis protein CcsA [Bryobacteraceae bacterium]|jgi:heme exporter protein C|nr:cytochrome c biogenesis protein CcsA [Bryobacteraceae bacterium]